MCTEITSGITPPIVSCYPEYGILFSLIKNESNPWLANNLIQIKLIPEWENFIGFINHDTIFDDCPFIQKEDSSVDKIINGDIVSFLARTISADVYAYLYLDRFYIHEYPEFQAIHYIHRAFVVGVDSETEQFILADNFKEGQFTLFLCSYEEMSKAFFIKSDAFVKDDILESTYHSNLPAYINDILSKETKAFIFADRFDIPALKTPFHFAHELEISSYDRTKGLISIISHHSPEETVICTEEQLITAYRKDPKSDMVKSLSLLKRVHFPDVLPINNQIICNELNKYLSSSKEVDIGNNYSFYYGISAMSFLLTDIQKTKAIKFRVFHFLFEHKVVMEMRVRYLAENNCLKHAENLLKAVTSLKAEFFELRNVAIKFSVRPTDNNLAHLLDLFRKAIDSDRQFTEQLLQSLQ